MFTPDRTLDALLALTSGNHRDRSLAVEESLRAACQLVEAEAASFLFYDGRRATRTTLLKTGAKIVEEHPNGDVISNQATENAFLQAAIVQRKFPDFRLGAHGAAESEEPESIEE